MEDKLIQFIGFNLLDNSSGFCWKINVLNDFSANSFLFETPFFISGKVRSKNSKQFYAEFSNYSLQSGLKSLKVAFLEASWSTGMLCYAAIEVAELMQQRVEVGAIHDFFMHQPQLNSLCSKLLWTHLYKQMCKPIDGNVYS